MKRVIVVIALALAMLLPVAAPAFAGTYNYNGSFYHLMYAGPSVVVRGATRCSGYQRQLSGTKPTAVRYALVTRRNTDPAQDYVHSWKTITGTTPYGFAFASFSAPNVSLRFWNLNYEGNWIGKNRVNTAGTFSGSWSFY